MVMEVLLLVKSFSYLLFSEEVRCIQDFFLQIQSFFGLFLEGFLELIQVEVDLLLVFIILGRQCLFNCILLGCYILGDFLELRKNYKNGLNIENMNLEVFDLVFIK